MWKKSTLDKIKKATLIAVAAVSISISTPNGNAASVIEFEKAYENGETWAIEENEKMAKFLKTKEGLEVIAEIEADNEFNDLETAYEDGETWAIEEIKAFKEIVNSPESIQMMIEKASEEDMPIEQVFAELAEFNKKYAEEQQQFTIIPVRY